MSSRVPLFVLTFVFNVFLAFAQIGAKIDLANQRLARLHGKFSWYHPMLTTNFHVDSWNLPFTTHENVLWCRVLLDDFLQMGTIKVRWDLSKVRCHNTLFLFSFFLSSSVGLQQLASLPSTMPRMFCSVFWHRKSPCLTAVHWHKPTTLCRVSRISPSSVKAYICSTLLNAINFHKSLLQSLCDTFKWGFLHIIVSVGLFVMIP